MHSIFFAISTLLVFFIIFIIYPIYTIVQLWRGKNYKTSEKTLWTVFMIFFPPIGSIIFSFIHETKTINKIAPLIGIAAMSIIAFSTSNWYEKKSDQPTLSKVKKSDQPGYDLLMLVDKFALDKEIRASYRLQRQESNAENNKKYQILSTIEKIHNDYKKDDFITTEEIENWQYIFKNRDVISIEDLNKYLQKPETETLRP